MRYSALVLTMLVVFLVPGRRASAQDLQSRDTLAQEEGRRAPPETSSSLQTAYRAGRQALKEDAPERAERLLRRAFEEQALYAPSPEQRPAAYWLGRAHQAQGDPARALQVWRKGLEVQGEKGTSSFLPLADAYLRLASEEGLGKRMATAVRAYHALVGSLGSAASTPVHSEIIRPYAARLGLILPASMRERVIMADAWKDALEEGRWAPGAGEVLLAWWRRQDPLPATPANERLAEHLRRVARASKQYAWEERPTGLDERGETYVRLGSPDRTYTLRFDEPEFMREVLRFGISVSRGDFPKNELWIYQSIDRAGRYIFVERDPGAYQLATSVELLPRRLRRHFGNTERGQNHAYSTLAALRYIYEELSLHYSSFGNLYSQVASYLSKQENAKNISALNRRRGRPPARVNTMSIGEGAGARVIYSDPNFGISFPNTFVSKIIQQGETQGRQLARRRAEVMPRQHTQVVQGLESLPVYVRTARFLEEGGATRTEIYWSTPVAALQLPEEMRKKIREAGEEPGAYNVLDLTTIQNTRRYVKRAAKRKRYLFEQRAKKGFLRPQTVTVKGDTAGLYHLALQWEQYPARITQRDGQREAHLGPRTRLRTYRVDSLRTLSSDGGRLEMSDLKPMAVPKGSSRNVVKLAEKAPPYPYEKIGAERSLLLYFEVYHLTFGADDRTRYTVDYEVYRRTERGGLLRQLFQGDEEQRTSTRTTHTGGARKAEEYILLDRSNIEADAEGEVTIAVRVTDEHTGQTQRRTLNFELLPPADRKARDEE